VAEEDPRARQDALRRSEALYRNLLESAPDAIVTVDYQGRIVLVNTQAETLFGYPRRALLGQPIELLLPETLRATHIQQRIAYQAAPRTRPMGGGLALYARRHDGSTFPVEISLSPVPTGDEGLVTAVVRDISARRAADDALRESEQRFHTLVQVAPVGVCILDEHGIFEEVNTSYAALLGYTPEELVGRHFQIVFPEALRIEAKVAFQQLLAIGGTSMTERVLRHRDGSTRTTLGTSVQIRDQDGRPRRALFVVDIEERKRVEAVLQASEARFRALIEHGSDIVRVIDAAGHILYASASHQRVLGYAPAEVVGRSWFDFIHPADHDRVRDALAALVVEGGTCRLINRARHAGGAYVTLEAILQNRLDDPAVRGIVINARDVTERQQAEEARAWLAAIVAGSSDAIIGMTLDRTIMSWNAGSERLYGYSADEVIGRSIDLIAVPGSPNEIAEIGEALLRGEGVTNLDTIRRHRDGRVLPVSISVSPVRDASGAIIGAAGIHRDIAARVRAEQAIQEARQFAEAMDRVSLALAATLDPERLYHIILEQAMAVLPCENSLIFEYRGDWAWVAASRGEPNVPPGTRLFPLTGPGRPWLATDHPSVIYLPDADLEPSWIHPPPWVGANRTRSVIAVPLRSEEGVLGAFQIHSTIPQRYEEHHLVLAQAFGVRIVQALRNAQLHVAEQRRAAAAEELARLRSDFVSAVNHELRTPLTVLLGFTELLQSRWMDIDAERRTTYLERISAAAHRQLRLVHDLLDASRVESPEFHCERRPFTLRSTIEQAADEVRSTYPGQRVDLHGPDELRVDGDAARTQQILANLIDNAAKYSPEGSPVEVAWGLEGEQVVTRVRDCGPGIPEAGQAQLFTRFGRLAGSQTRSGRSGTGLGLYLSRMLARSMGGDLDLEGTGSHGSTFRLLLPSAPKHPSPFRTPL
jgi:PAS domain S-box-containing protein